MKRIAKLIYSSVFTVILTIYSCSDDDISNVVTLENFITSINENPTNGEVIGNVQANQTVGGAILTYTIVSQTPSGALSINSNTGELSVNDASLFNFETNPLITAVVSTNQSTNEASITIELNDVHEVGDYKFGGVVFWVNQTGDEGYVCSVVDQTTGIQWYNGSNGNTSARDTSLGAGQSNTSSIVSFQGNGSYAAQLCNDLELNGYDDWFLPSIGELEEMYNNKEIINATSVQNSGNVFDETGVGQSGYWSSTESTNSQAIIIRFSDGYYDLQGAYKSLNYFNVRAVRAWTDF